MYAIQKCPKYLLLHAQREILEARALIILRHHWRFQQSPDHYHLFDFDRPLTLRHLSPKITAPLAPVLILRHQKHESSRTTNTQHP